MGTWREHALKCKHLNQPEKVRLWTGFNLLRSLRHLLFCYIIIVTVITIVIVILPPLFGNLFSDSYVVNSCPYFEALDKCYLLRAFPHFPEHRHSLLSVPSARRTFLDAGKECITLQVCLPARQ